MYALYAITYPGVHSSSRTVREHVSKWIIIFQHFKHQLLMLLTLVGEVVRIYLGVCAALMKQNTAEASALSLETVGVKLFR